jgi:hypothetical protein
LATDLEPKRRLEARAIRPSERASRPELPPMPAWAGGAGVGAALARAKRRVKRTLSCMWGRVVV